MSKQSKYNPIDLSVRSAYNGVMDATPRKACHFLWQGVLAMKEAVTQSKYKELQTRIDKLESHKK